MIMIKTESKTIHSWFNRLSELLRLKKKIPFVKVILYFNWWQQRDKKSQ